MLEAREVNGVMREVGQGGSALPPWLLQRPWAALFAIAFSLRLATAVVTEFFPLFPAYYYTDALEHDQTAWQMVEDYRASRPLRPTLSPGKRIYDYYLAGLYLVFGHQPLLPRAINALAASLAVLVLLRTARLLVASSAAAWFGLALAFWPSHVYFSSQNLKDSFVLLLIALAAHGSVAYLYNAGNNSRSAQGWALLPGMAGFLLILGLFKNYFTLMFAAAMAAGYLAAAWMRPKVSAYRGSLAMGVVWLVLTLALQRPLSRLVFTSLLKPSQELSALADEEVGLLPYSGREGAGTFILSSPENIAAFRYYRQSADQQHAAKRMGRRIGTQIAFGEKLEDWWDVARFLPYGLWNVLFMPLPGLSPLEGNLGRLAAACENVLLLGLSLLSLYHFVSAPKEPEHWLLACFFWTIAVASGLFEFDLGSAARHKLEYLPFALVFAFHSLKARRTNPP